MGLPKKTPKKGRPFKSPVSKFRAMTWYIAVSEESNKDASSLEAEFYTKASGNGNAKKAVRPCLFDKYRRGDVEPRRTRGKDGQPSIVERVEECYPETTMWLELPLWDAMDFDHISMAGIREIYEKLPVNIRQYFIATEKVSSGGFWRKPTDPELVYHHLIKIVTIDSLTAAFNMSREGLISQNQKLHFHGLKVAEEILAGMLQRKSSSWDNVILLMQDYVAMHRDSIKYSPDGEHVTPAPITRLSRNSVKTAFVGHS